MARRKNSTALFEVMAAHRARQLGSSTSTNGAASHGAAPITSASGEKPPTDRPQQSVPRSYAPPPGQLTMKTFDRPGILATGAKIITDWLETRARARQAAIDAAPPPVVEAFDSSDPTAGVTAQSLSARVSAPARNVSARSAAVAEPAEPVQAVISPTTAEIVAEPAPAQVAPVSAPRDRPRPAKSSRAALARSLKSVLPGRDARELAAREEPNEVTSARNDRSGTDRGVQPALLRIRFSTAVIGGMALFTVLGVAYFAGTHFGQPEKSVAKKQQKSVVDPKTGKPVPNPSRRVTPDGAIMAGGQSLATPPTGPAGVDALMSTPTGFVDSPISNGTARRTPGFNYCIIKSFVPEMRDQAIEASHALSAAGIANTIEPGTSKLRSEPGSWLVIGTRGFNRGYSQSADYADYMDRLKEVVAKSPPKARLRPLQTLLIKWTE